MDGTASGEKGSKGSAFTMLGARGMLALVGGGTSPNEVAAASTPAREPSGQGGETHGSGGGGRGVVTEQVEQVVVADHAMFDTGTPEGRAALAQEAVAEINDDVQLKKALKAAGDGPGGAVARRAAVQRLLDHCQTEAAQHEEDILATVQGGEEGQESLDLALGAATDMTDRLKTFSDRAVELRGEPPWSRVEGKS